MVEFYEVGGSVRDYFLNLESKDIDYSVIASSYEEMRQSIIDRGGEIFLETPEYYTIRAKLPDIGPADFVWCRKEGPYSDGRHPDWVKPGTLQDDLARRDFTMNAIALTPNGGVVDPHRGYSDIKNRVIRCVGCTECRMREDKLRALRALRFSITKKMRLDNSIEDYISDISFNMHGVSLERIREELFKMFKYDTKQTLRLFAYYDFKILDYAIDHGIWLKPTTEKVR